MKTTHTLVILVTSEHFFTSFLQPVLESPALPAALYLLGQFSVLLEHARPQVHKPVRGKKAFISELVFSSLLNENPKNNSSKYHIGQ